MAVITGTTGDDLNLTGTSDPDTINALAGNDTIIGFVGADIVNGSTGNDTIALTATSTDLNAAINTQIVGVEAVTAAGAADDVIINLGLQTEGFAITGGAHNDTITGGAGADSIIAGAGNDSINGFVGADTVDGGANNDTLFLSATSTTLNVATNAQLVNVEHVNASGAAAGVILNLANQTETNLRITGSALADTITGTAGADDINAGSGNDTINGFTAGDDVDGEIGFDSILLTTQAAVAALNAADDSDIERVEAISAAGVGAAVTIDLSNQDEGFRITGTTAADTIIGANGNDTIVGFTTGDSVNGGDGGDSIELTATSTALNAALNSAIVDVETVTAAGAVAGVVINLSNQTEGFEIIGGNGSDTITGTADNDDIHGGGGNDVVNGFTSGDEVDGGSGNDRLVLAATSTALNQASDDEISSIETIAFTGALAGVTADLDDQDEGFTIIGTAFADTITGGAGADNIQAGVGNDTIKDFEGADVVDGGTGIDTLVLNDTSDDLNVAINTQLLGVETVTAAGASDGVTINLGLQTEGFTITGGSGNDRITGGAGADIIDAGDGNDTINGFVGADTVDGGDGNDKLALITTSATLNAATDAQLADVERVDLDVPGGLDAGVVLNLANQSEGFTINGSIFADTISGGAGADNIDAGAGDDLINGFTLGDEVDGGDRTDTLAIRTLAAVSALNAADDSDISDLEAVTAAGTSSAVTLDLSNQSDDFRITGTNFADTIIGSGGDNTIVGFVGADTIDGNNGSDTIALTVTSTALNAALDGAITDVEAVSAENATSAVIINLANQSESFGIAGGDFADTITGTANDDEIFGDGGNDTINGFTTDDEVDGGTGIDRIVLTTLAAITAINAADDGDIVNVEAVTAASLTSGVTLDLSNQSEAFGSGITGSAFSDTITGSSGVDVIFAGAGNDTIIGKDSDDTVDGGTGIDTLVLTDDLTGAGNVEIVNVEAVTAASLSGGVTIDLREQSEGFTITGGSGDDSIFGGAGIDSINGGAGNDTINEFVGADTVNGGADIDTIALSLTSAALNAATDAQIVSVEKIDLLGENDVGAVLNLANQSEGFDITGSDFADTITGGAGADLIHAGEGDDTINGFAAGDEIDGENGTDTLAVKTLAAVAAFNAASNGDITHVEAVTAVGTSGPVTLDLTNQSEGFSIAGTSFADTIIGTGADDTIVGFVGADTVDGNGGTDKIALTATSTTLNAALDGAITDIEEISAAGASAAVAINRTNQSESFRITGGDFNDTITGFVAGDEIDGGLRTDTIVLTTQAALAALNAADDGDIVRVEAVNAAGIGAAVNIDLSNQTDGGFIITGTAFADTITGSDGGDTILAGSGNDTINGFVGVDIVDGGSGTDTIVLTGPASVVGANMNILNVEAVNASGATGGVTIDLGNQTEAFLVTGSSHDDEITGGAGIDTINAGTGNDIIYNFVGADKVDGGADIDTLMLLVASTALNAATDAQLVNVEKVDTSGVTDGVTIGVTLNLANQTEGFEITSYVFADTITGSAGVDTIHAGGGNDTINGYTAGDSIDGEAGTDTIMLTTQAASTALTAAADGLIVGVEAVSAVTASVAITIDLHNQTEGFSITGGKAADTLIGSGGADTFVNYVGADTLDGNGGTDTLLLTATSKTLSTALDAAITGVEAINASSAITAVSIVLTNQTEGFNITGSNLADTITGGAGADTITGGGGNDKLNGGVGDDTFVFNAGNGADTITGFVAGAATDDVIDLRSFALADFNAVLALATDNGTDTVIDFGASGKITLLGVTEIELHADDFLLA